MLRREEPAKCGRNFYLPLGKLLAKQSGSTFVLKKIFRRCSDSNENKADPWARLIGVPNGVQHNHLNKLKTAHFVPSTCRLHGLVHPVKSIIFDWAEPSQALCDGHIRGLLGER